MDNNKKKEVEACEEKAYFDIIEKTNFPEIVTGFREA